MNPDDIAAGYDKIASYWDGPEFNRGNGIAQHQRALQFCAGSGMALDAGCAVRHLEYDQFPLPHVYVIAQRMSG